MIFWILVMAFLCWPILVYCDHASYVRRQREEWGYPTRRPRKKQHYYPDWDVHDGFGSQGPM